MLGLLNVVGIIPHNESSVEYKSTFTAKIALFIFYVIGYFAALILFHNRARLRFDNRRGREY